MSENHKKIWITGASSGIGKAVAEKFAKEGWKVAVSARRKELLDKLAKNENISSFPLDVTDRSHCINTVRRTSMADSNLVTQKQQVFDYVNAMLGGGMIDVELDPMHYETALTKAFTKYRQRSENAVEESYITIKLEENVNTYTLPQEVIEVRKIFRRSIGSRLGGSADGGSLFEPFNLAYTNMCLCMLN